MVKIKILYQIVNNVTDKLKFNMNNFSKEDIPICMLTVVIADF